MRDTLKKRLDVTYHTLDSMRVKLLENPYYDLDVSFILSGKNGE